MLSMDSVLSQRVLGMVSELTIQERNPLKGLDEITVRRKRVGPDTYLWGVYCGPRCLTRDGAWETEPPVAERDDGFLDRCRFATLAEALEAAQQVSGCRMGAYSPSRAMNA